MKTVAVAMVLVVVVVVVVMKKYLKRTVIIIHGCFHFCELSLHEAISTLLSFHCSSHCIFSCLLPVYNNLPLHF
jgi:hypothetical protein